MLSKKSLVACYSIWPETKDLLRSRLRGHKVAIHTKPLHEAELDRNTEVLVSFIDSPVNKEVIAKLPKLRLIATLSTGFDHIDLKTCRKRGITVSNVPTYGENTVAEHTFALILGLTRKLFLSAKRVKEGRYDYHGLRGTDLSGKTLGVIGTGHIGIKVIDMARGFGMRVVAYDLFPNSSKADKHGFTYTTLPTLLTESDVITLHTPLTDETRHLINKRNIKKIKPGSFIINTARGGLVEPEALVWALTTNHIAGAGIDVLEDENLIQDEEKLLRGDITQNQLKNSVMNNYIIDHENTIVTPHNAFNSTEALKRIVTTTTDNITSFLQGKPTNVVS